MSEQRATTDPSPATPAEATSSGETPAVWAVRPHGEIDVERAPRLAEQFDAVLARGAKVVVVDLSNASFLDSTGLRVIVRAAERLRERDGQLLLEGASGAVSRVLEVTGLLEHYADLAKER